MIHRRREVSRIEGFSDAVFAFALTLLVVSLEVPKTFNEMLELFRGLPAFAVSFAMLYQVWWRHYRFFRNYDIEDSVVIVLTGILLFVVLFYVYPLKFIWSLAFSGVVGQHVEANAVTREQAPFLFAGYGLGFAAVFGILAALYAHAYRLRTTLALTPAELLRTRVEIYRNIGYVGFGVLSTVIAAVTARFAPSLLGFAGFVYFGIGILETAIGTYEGRQLRRPPRGASTP